MIRIHCDICNCVIPESTVLATRQGRDTDKRAAILVADNTMPKNFDIDYTDHHIYHICESCGNNKYLKMLNDDILDHESMREGASIRAQKKAMSEFDKHSKEHKSEMYRRLICLRNDMRKKD